LDARGVRQPAGFEQPAMLAGHTRVQLARLIEGTLDLNPGSVGLPFRGFPLGELQLISPWAEYALVRLEDQRISVELGGVVLPLAGGEELPRSLGRGH
jgi:hypothetical protein